MRKELFIARAARPQASAWTSAVVSACRAADEAATQSGKREA